MHEVAHAPKVPHIEGHFESTATVRDIVIGLSDGLTVPFPRAVCRGYRCDIAIVSSYVAGGFIPLIPYMLVSGSLEALTLCVVIPLVALALFAALKGKLVGTGWLRSAIQTTLIGGIAAAAAYALASLLNGSHP